ncbi:hypothetical protein COLO4_16562 [Corchorus olitorius]|uniref:Uncharacterized protein n=1 Tax=Corchorus olitorius TaxID=93759 RepID=A0A1R3JGT1_9ROSI|nr:hypothetical protein COLO4_16562 [Corchorus olitorius]
MDERVCWCGWELLWYYRIRMELKAELSWVSHHLNLSTLP